MVVVLAGGENRRFPYNKGMINIKGMPIIERILTAYGKLFENIVISTNSPDVYFRYGVMMAGDVLDRRGPMTGILSSMIACEDEWFFVTACDMPFVNEKLVRRIISVKDKKADAVIPLYNKEPQPLPGRYHRRLIERLYGNIMNDRKGMKLFLNEIETRYIDERAVREIDPHGKSFININTINDLEKIQGGCECLG